MTKQKGLYVDWLFYLLIAHFYHPLLFYLSFININYHLMHNSRLSTEISLVDNSDKYIMSRRKQQLLATLAHSKSQMAVHLAIIRRSRAELTGLEEKEEDKMM